MAQKDFDNAMKVADEIKKNFVFKSRRNKMRQNLLETYSRQLKVAEAYISKNFDKSISRQTQLTTAHQQQQRDDCGV